MVASKKPGGFWIHTNARSLELVADSAHIAESWVRVLQDTANQVPQQVQVQRTPSSRVSAAPSAAEDSWDIDANGESDIEEDSGPIKHQGDRPERVRVLYDYAAAEDDELTMEAGQIIDVIDSEGDWWMGRIGVRIGNFPSNYVVPYEVGQTI